MRAIRCARPLSTFSLSLGFTFTLIFTASAPVFAQTTNATLIHAGGSQSAAAYGDADGNAWPDNPFATLSGGDLWLATTPSRTVAALKWSAGDTAPKVIELDIPREDGSTQRTRIEAPAWLTSAGETAVLLIGIAYSLDDLFGSTEAAELGGTGFQPVMVQGAPCLEISVILSTDNGATFDELDPARLTDAPIRLRIENLTAEVAAIPILYKHPTYIAADPQTGLVPIAEPGDWTPAPAITLPYTNRDPDATTEPVYLEADLRSLSVFALLDAAPDSGTGSTGGSPVDSSGTGTTGSGDGGGTDSTNTDTNTESTGTTTSGGGTLPGGDPDSLTLDDPEGGQTAMLMPGDDIWVDFGSAGTEDGTQVNPYNQFAEGIWFATVNGSDTVNIDRQTPIYRSGESGTFNPPSPITVQAVNGPVRIGEATATLFTYFTGIGAVVYEPEGESLSELSYAINPEARTFPEDAAVTVKAYPAEGYKFDGWWFPEDPTQPASPEDLLVAGIHSFTLDRDRLLWPIFTENTESLDTADPDEDGLANFRDAELGTNPTLADTDSDGLPDWWEVNYGLDPLSGQGSSGASGNPDEDPWVNSVEFGFAASPVVPGGQNALTPLIEVSGFVRIVPPAPWESYYADPHIIEVITPPEFGPSYPSLSPKVRCYYPAGTSVTWRFTPQSYYANFYDPEWTTDTASANDVVATGNELTFVADVNSLGNPWIGYNLRLKSPPPPDRELLGIEVSSPGSLEDTFFPAGYTEWGTPDGTPIQTNNQREAMQAQVAQGLQDAERLPYPRAAEVWFEAVRERTIAGDTARPFSIDLNAILNSSFPPQSFEVLWSYEAGSIAAGNLVTEGLSAKLEFDETHPAIPGLYKIRCEVRVSGEASTPLSRTAVAYILLPFAGPDVQDWMIQEARQIVDGPPGYPGVGEQWVLYMLDEGPIQIIDLPVVGEVAFDPFRRLERAFASVAAFRFDYTQIMFLQGLERPTRKYSYTMNEWIESDPDRTDHVNFPAYATVDNTVLVRGRINVVLFTVWAKAVFFASVQNGYPENPNQDELLFAGAWLNNLGKGLKKSILDGTIDIEDLLDDPTATETGISLYNAIRENRDDAWIKEHVLTPDRALGMQTISPTVYDRVLWPRGDYSAAQNTTPWIENTGLTTLDQFDRPFIFLPFEDMDLDPWTASSEN